MPGLRNTLHEFAQGSLHSGSPTGPVVTNPKQAVAIGLNDKPKKKASKFKHHHTAAGDAFAKGDHQLAMHHVGHMLTALRTGQGAMPMPEEAGETAPDVESPAEDAKPFGGMRGRLSATAKK